MNRSVGNCALGQAVLVENRPRTLDARSVIEWLGTASASYNGDERNAQRVSQRVDRTIRSFDLASAKAFYDKYAHEYYVIGPDGTALVYGVDCDAWYIYTSFAARCLINYKDELYFGTARRLPQALLRDYRSTRASPSTRAGSPAPWTSARTSGANTRPCCGWAYAPRTAARSP